MFDLAFFPLLHLPLKHDINSAMNVSHIHLAFFALLHLPLKHDINSAMYVSHIRLAFVWPKA